MPVIFVHLSGGRRGTEELFDQDRVSIGSAPDNDLRFDPGTDPAVAPHHAEARVEGGEVLLTDRGSGRALFVNTQPVTKIILRDGDLVEVGEEGPMLRFRLAPEEVTTAKSLRTLVADAQARVRAARRGRVGSATAFIRYLAIAVAREASPAVRLAFVLGLLQMVLFLVGVPILLVAGQWQLRQTRTAIANISARLRAEGLSQEGLQGRVEAARRAVEEQQQALGSVMADLRRERDRLRTDLAAAESRLQRLEAAQSAIAGLSTQPRVVTGSPVVRELTREVPIFGYTLTAGEAVLVFIGTFSVFIGMVTILVMVWLGKVREMRSD